MAIRAVIIGVENYPRSAELAPKLDGTLDHARRFKDWLTGKKDVPEGNIQFCADPKKAEISCAFRQVVDDGKDDTEELYVFFSGHGFSFNDNPFRQMPADVVVGSDFENLRDSGDACLKLNDIQFMMWQCMGPGDHYYFVDACRNFVSAAKVNPGTLGWTRDPSNTGQPRVFTLFSTKRDSVSAVESGFGPALVEGLHGRGRAKQRERVRMFVTFESLCRYLESSLQQKVEYEPGGGPGRILEIAPIPVCNCEVQIQGATPGDTFNLTVLDHFQRTIRGPQQFTGDRTAFSEYPDDYFVQVTHPQAAIDPSQPAEADLYDDCTVTFRKLTAPAGVPRFVQPPAPPSVTLTGAHDTTLLIRNLQTGERIDAGETFSGALEPGDYQVRMLERGLRTVRRRNFSLKPGDTTSLDLGRRPATAVRESLVHAIPGSHDEARVDFSESLGPMANADLGLWLSLAGASRIVREWGDFSKLRYLPLDKFEDVQPGASPLYILLGLETLPGSVEIGISDGGASPDWQNPRVVPGLEGVYEHRANIPAGPHLVSVRLQGKAPLTTATFCLANHATFIAVAQDVNAPLGIHQYILPLAKLQDQLSQRERERQPENALAVVRFIALAQKQLARRRTIEPSPENKAFHEDYSIWAELLDGRLLDPILAIMASYELLRNGAFSARPGDQGEHLLRNLRICFGSIPDVAAIARLAGVPFLPPAQVPLFLAGFSGLGEYAPELPLPRSRLDFRGPWISWIGAVE